MAATCVSSAQASRSWASPAAAAPVPLPGMGMGDVSVQGAAGRAGRELECPGCGCQEGRASAPCAGFTH